MSVIDESTIIVLIIFAFLAMLVIVMLYPHLTHAMNISDINKIMRERIIRNECNK